MLTIGIGLGVGVVYLASRIYERKKNKQVLEDVLLTQKFEVYEYSKWMTYALYGMVVLSIICAVVGYFEKNELNRVIKKYFG